MREAVGPKDCLRTLNLGAKNGKNGCMKVTLLQQEV